MRRRTTATVLRWLFIISCVAPYWLAVAWMIVDARANTQDVFAWLCCGIATLPWTAIFFFFFEPTKENERAWWTAITVASALLNGLLFALGISWLARGRRRRTDPQAADYDDKPPTP